MRTIIVTALLGLAGCLALPSAASALDCTPFQTWTCAQQGYFDVLNGQPGEVVCGTDYAGWTLHVVQVDITQAGWVRFAGVSAASSGVYVATAIMLMDDCAAGVCIASTQNSSMAELDVCLDVGSHTFVVASHTTAAGAFMNIGIICPTCAQAETAGFPCPYCETVGNEDASWGSVKSQYR